MTNLTDLYNDGPGNRWSVIAPFFALCFIVGAISTQLLILALHRPITRKKEVTSKPIKAPKKEASGKLILLSTRDGLKSENCLISNTCDQLVNDATYMEEVGITKGYYVMDVRYDMDLDQSSHLFVVEPADPAYDIVCYAVGMDKRGENEILTLYNATHGDNKIIIKVPEKRVGDTLIILFRVESRVKELPIWRSVVEDHSKVFTIRKY